MKQNFLITLFLLSFFSWSNTDKYRLILVNNPSTSITVAWNQVSGSNPIVYYGTTDYGTNWISYPNSKTVSRSISYRGMNNQFARLSNLSPNTTYYFVIKDSQGTSQRYWFKTAPNDLSRLSFIAGGDSRNNRLPRQRANKLVAKLKPHAVFFGGDMTDSDNDAQWQEWFEDWQLTIASDGRMFPIVPVRGNHEGASTIYNLFDTPTSDSYYALTFGNNLIRMYSLNSEISVTGNQNTWLNNDLQSNSNVIWKGAQYHKPMRPHNAAKSEGNHVYNAWAQTFYNNEVRLVVDCDSHTVKSTWPIKPSTASGNDEGFIRDDTNGTVYLGEGCWGAPLRSNNDNKTWTRNSGSFNQFKLIFVDANKIEARTIKVDNADTVGSVSNTNPFVLPTNLDVWNPSNGSLVEIFKNNNDPQPEINISNLINGQCLESNVNQIIQVSVIEEGSGINQVDLYINNTYISTDTTAPFAFNYTFSSGYNTIKTVATDANGKIASSEKNIIVDQVTSSVTFSIGTGNDDVEEAQNGTIYTNSSDLELVYDSYNSNGFQTVGLRFTNISIPQGATINNAYIQFTSDETHSNTSQLIIAIENTSNASPFGTSSYNVSSRNYLSSVVNWSPNAWTATNQAGNDQKTPSIVSLIQAIINKSNWQSGNAIVFNIKGTGVSLSNTSAKRVADSYEGGTSKAAKLIVNYSMGCQTSLSKINTQIEKQPTFLLGEESIDIHSDEEIVAIKIYDLNGKEIFSKENIAQEAFSIHSIYRKNEIIIINIFTRSGKIYRHKIVF